MQEKNFILVCIFFLIFGHAQQGGVGIGNTVPNSSAILDVTSTNKGFQLPVVSLTSTADISTVQAPKRGFVIYNTAVAGTGMSSVNKGLYVFNGTAWEKMFTKANIITEVEKIPFITPVFAASNIATSSSIAGVQQRPVLLSIPFSKTCRQVYRVLQEPIPVIRSKKTECT